MKISINSWHGHIYKWWWKMLNTGKPLPQTVSLCPYVRTVLLWAPIIFVLHLFTARKYGPTYGAVFTIGGWLILIAKYGKAGYIALPLALILGIFYLAERGSKSREKTKQIPPPKPPSIFRLLVAAYWQAVHTRVCPIIEIVDDTNADGKRVD